MTLGKTWRCRLAPCGADAGLAARLAKSFPLDTLWKSAMLP
jgi:hypothetical protein